MKDKRTWEILQDLEDAFDKVITIEFLVERLQIALEKNNMSEIIDITHALNAFLPVFIQNYDENLKKTWMLCWICRNIRRCIDSPDFER